MIGKININRRSFLQVTAVAGATTIARGLAPGTVLAAPAAAGQKSPGETTFLVLDNANIVETAYGNVRGLQRNGIHIFRGIPYGADTSGENRFMPAKKPEPWTGIRSALWFGHTCPTVWSTDGDESEFLFRNDVGIMGEECLVANVWTPGINDNKKRPVMVWIHGGGFDHGSDQELEVYDGGMLARSGDVVVVGFNHRLNAFGFMNLSEFGPDYATSGNNSMTDIVFLLEWVRDNIANFGGDPGNVTIMGQSGGGAKVSTIMAMPSAKGLFHRASIHSGSMLEASGPDRSLGMTHAVLKELGVSKDNLDKLRKLSSQELLNAWQEVQRRNRSAGHPDSMLAMPDPRAMARGLGWGPYVDGDVIPKQVWGPTAPEISAVVPLMVGTVLNEFLNGKDRPDAFSMTDDQMMKQLTDHYGALAPELAQVFRKGHPEANPFQLLSIISTCSVRADAVTQAQRKAALGKAPAYNFWFQWQTPILSGRPMAFHCADLNFFFNNSERCAYQTGNGPEAQRLAAQMSQVWIHFARTGNPNHSGIPKWEPVTANGSETMIFDTVNRFSPDPDSAERRAIASATTAT
jgi:para-nitrobenzyl esterase